MANPNSSSKFKKKPSQVEACSVTLILTAKPADYPQWVVDAFAAKQLIIEGGTLSVVSTEGLKTAAQGDMLVRTEKGWLMPYKIDDFNAAFELIPPGP